MDAIRLIKEHIESAGISARAFGRRLGVSHSYLHGIFIGRQRPSFKIASEIASLVFAGDEARQKDLVIALMDNRKASVSENNQQTANCQQAVDSRLVQVTA